MLKKVVAVAINPAKIFWLSGFLLCVGLTGVVGAPTASAFSGGGVGQPYSPFVITTCDQLQEINQNLSAHYILGGNIDCTGSGPWNSGAGFEPISGFTGVLDGRNYTVNGLTMSRGAADYIGVFGSSLEGTVKNVKFTNISITTTSNGEYVGGLAGEASGAYIQNVQVSGTVVGGIVVGGMVGYINDGAVVVNSSFTGNMTDLLAYGGGFAGFIYNSSVSDSYANATYVGANVGAGFAARLIADNASAAVTNSYFVGTSQNSNYRASFISDLYEAGSGEVSVINSFVVASGTPDGVTPQNTYPFAQKTGTPTVTNFFYDADLAGIENCGAGIATCTAMNTDGLSPNYYRNTNAVAPLSSWNFLDTWQTTVDYPTLRDAALEQIGTEFAGGDGSELDPYQIEDCEQLQAVRQQPLASFILNNDIDCSATSGWNEGRGFEPIAKNSVFEGTFDGNNHTISDLYIDRADDEIGQGVNDEDYVGLFAATDGALIVDVSLEDTYVKGYQYVGGLVGNAIDTDIYNVTVNLTTEDNPCNPGHCIWARYGYDGGGIVGVAESGTVIENVATGGPVKGSGNYIGGIVGELYGSSLAYSYSEAIVDGGTYIGGVAGYIEDSQVVGTYATGNVYGNDEQGKTGSVIGGFVGAILYSSVEDSYAEGAVVATGDTVGGFAGGSYCGTTYDNAYASGDVTAAGTGVGGFAGSDGCEGPGSTYNNVFATGDVSGYSQVGGLLGDAMIATLNRTYALGNVTASGSSVGGLAGKLFGATGGTTTVRESFALGNVVADGVAVGGLVGTTDGDGNIFADVFSRGSVTGAHIVGGVLGFSTAGTNITNGYATGLTLATDELGSAGGIIGSGEGGTIVSSSFWDADTTQVGGTDGTAKTTAEMKNIATYTDEDTAGLTQAWDFEGTVNDDVNTDDIWQIGSAINDGYPCFTWLTNGCDFSDTGAPPDEDLNGDSIPDVEQSNIGGYISPITGKLVAIDVGDGCELTTDDMTSEAQLDVQDPAYEYANGLWDFEADCGTPGYTTTIKLYYYDVSPDKLVLRKYNPNTSAFTTIADANIVLDTINGQSVTVVTYQVTDGGERDTDGTVDGLIKDPAGLASLVVGVPNTGLGRDK